MKVPLKFNRIASSELQNIINISIIFNHLRENSPISRAKISKNLNISAPAVSRVVAKLINRGYVKEIGKVKTVVGKRPTELEINLDKGFILGVDLSKDKIKLALANFRNEIIEKYIGHKIENDIDLTKFVVNNIENFFKQMGRNNINAICISVPANVDPESGVIVGVPLYKNWINLNLKKDLSKSFDIPIYIENEANLAALAEKYYGVGKIFSNLVSIQVSVGIGAGIIIDDHLFKGFNGLAGEIGFTIIDTKNLNFKVKNKGFLERFASIDSLKKIVISELLKGRKSLINDLSKGNSKKVNNKIILEALKRGDELAVETIGNMINYLSIVIINLILILNPQIIIIGGDIVNFPDIENIILNPIIKTVKKSLPFDIPEIILSALSDDASLIGATYLGVESLLLNEFPFKIDTNKTF